MVKAVVDRGEIRPLDPLPVDWREGQLLQVDTTADREMTLEEIDRVFAELEVLCSTSDPADEEILERAINESRRLSKEQVRKSMGLS